MARIRTSHRVLATTTIAIVIASTTLGGIAFAKSSGPKPAKVSCTSVSGTVAGGDAVSGCSGQGGSGTFVGNLASTSGTATVEWANGTVNQFSYSGTPLVSGKKDKCGAGNIEFPLKGAITSNVPAPGTGGVKGAVKGDICVNGTTSDLSLLKGTFKF